MADKKSGGGFKSFLLILLIIVMSFFLFAAAWLIVIPDSKIFGVSYASFSKNEVIKIDNSSSIYYNNYSKIIVDTTSEGHGLASVEVNYGTGLSEVRFIQNSKGFMKGDARSEYSLSVDTTGGVLNIKLLEPHYNFLCLNSQTRIKLNISQVNDPNISNLDITIKTNKGNIKIGGPTDESLKAYDMNILNADLNTVGGRITLTHLADVSNTLNLTSKNNSITIEDNISAQNTTISAEKGKITTQNFLNGNVAVTSTKSHIELGNIAGNASLNTRSGTVNFKKIGGNFQTGDKLDNAYINIEEVAGSVSINNYESDITVKIGKIMGETLIKAGSRSVDIEEVYGYANITTKGGSIDVTKVLGNANNLVLQTTSGDINAELQNVINTNTFISTSGTINVKYDSAQEFILNANSEKGSIYLKGEKMDNLSGHMIGSAPNSSNNITASSNSGRINIGWL